jgi:hypothetical protein
VNCIIWANNGQQIVGDLIAAYSAIQGGYPGTGNIDADPLFVTGPAGDYYLSQIAAGQSQQSPCVNAGDPASPMIDGTTRTDGVPDEGIVDMGYHYLAFNFPPPPPIDITLMPFNPPIIIEPSGGQFSFEIAIANNTDSSQTFDGWATVQLPGGTQFPTIPPINLTLPANFTLLRARDQLVPATAPAGDYIYWGFVGTYPWTIADSDSFPFTKLGSNRDWLGADGWLSSGEPLHVGSCRGLVNQTPSLHAAIPNPFNPTTVARFELQAASLVKLTVYDISGREVAKLVDGWSGAGSHEVTFDGSSLPSGIYFAKLQAGEYAGAQKLVLLK